MKPKRTRRYLVRTTLSFFCLLMYVNFAHSQTQRSWADGDPSFQETYDSTNVQSNGIVELIRTPGLESEPDTFLIHLTGIDMLYPKSDQSFFSPEDFNQLPDVDLYMIADAFDRRVFVIRPADGLEIIEFKGEPSTPEAMERPVKANAFLDQGIRKVLITDEGTHRILKFDYDTQVLEWVYGTGSQGSGPNELSTPASAVAIPDSGQILICDRGNNRLLIVDAVSKNVVWTWGPGILSDPIDAEWVQGNVLVTDRGDHRVLMINIQTGQIVWQFGTGDAALSDSTLNSPVDAQFLIDGNILIADAGNKRLIEVDANGRITWQFLGELPGLKSCFRLSDGKTLVVAENLPKRLGYSAEAFISEVHDLGQPVNYDSLRWDIEQPVGTTAQFQIRAANFLGDLESSPWLGPDSLTPYYTTQTGKINPEHDGNRFYQYRVELETQDPLISPVLNNVNVLFHYFDPDTAGKLTSPAIRDSAGIIITRWRELEVNTILPDNPALRNLIDLEIRILNADTGELLQSFTASNNVSTNLFILDDVDRLKTIQAVQLQAVFLTNNSSISPKLDFWRISWQTTSSSISNITFTDDLGDPTRVIRAKSAADAGANPPGNVFISLVDQNLVDVQNAVEVNLVSKVSGDQEKALLELRANGEYTLFPGIPAVIQTLVVPNNGLLEMADRDTLVVRYVDPTDPTDRSQDSVLVVQFTPGALAIEDRAGNTLDIASIGDTLYMRLTGKLDRSITSGQDTVFADFFDNITNDLEEVMLLEVPDTSGASYTSGEFFSAFGIPLRRQATSVPNDGILQTLPGNDIGARYVDEYDRIEVSAKVRQDSTTVLPPANGPYDFLVGPNPFRASDASQFRLRICAFSGDLVVQRVDIYNLAGERIRTLTANDLALNAGIVIPSGTCSVSNNWWNLQTEAGTPAASGTYWARFTADFTDQTGSKTAITFMRKFILIQ